MTGGCGNDILINPNPPTLFSRKIQRIYGLALFHINERYRHSLHNWVGGDGYSHTAGRSHNMAGNGDFRNIH